MPSLFRIELKEYNMEQFFNDTAENEDMLHSWQISVVSLGMRVLQLEEKYYGQDKIK
jgi:hypothetical protein